MISIVIPSYNRRNCMLALLEDLRRQQDVDFEVIVVDDHSTDDSVCAIIDRFPEVLTTVNKRNSGPAVTRNTGIRQAHGDIIVGFDSDVTLPDPRLLAKIAERFKFDASVDGLAFRILAPDGRADDVGRWWHPRPIATHAEKSFPTSYFSGTAYAFRRVVMETADLFPEVLYMHYEEVGLAWRVLDLGGTIYYDPSLSVIHHANPVSRRSQIEVFYKPRNQVLLAISCMPWPHAIRFLVPRVLYQGAKAIFNGHVIEFFNAMRSAVSLTPHILKLRKPLSTSTMKRLKNLAL